MISPLLGRTHERHFGASGVSDPCDLDIVGGDPYAIEAAAGLRGCDRPCVEQSNVRVRNALATGSCRDLNEPHVRTALAKAAATVSCCVSVSPEYIGKEIASL